MSSKHCHGCMFTRRSQRTRKVLNKLNFSVPEDVVRKVAQCTPGVVELVLIPLRQKIEEKQRQMKMSSNSYQEPGMHSTLEDSNYLDTGYSSKTKTKPNSTGIYIQDSPGSDRGTKGAPLQNEALLRLQLAERDQALLALQETVQILQMKVRRLEHLLQLKNVRIDDLTRRVQQQQQPKRK
nr:sperm flagellar protein 1 [Anolis sagrei ordinatus]